MRLTTKGRFAVTAMIDLALRENTGPVALAAIRCRQQISLSYLEQLFVSCVAMSSSRARAARAAATRWAARPIRSPSPTSSSPSTSRSMPPSAAARKTAWARSGRCMTHDLWAPDPHFPIYMDYAATTPVDPRVVDAMVPYLYEQFGNPASRSHAYGWAAEEAVEIAREHVAALLGADPREIVWTSGATESNNLAIKGAAHFYKAQGQAPHHRQDRAQGRARHDARAGARGLRGDLPRRAAGRPARPRRAEGGDPPGHHPGLGHVRQQRDRRHPGHRRDRRAVPQPRHHLPRRCGAGHRQGRDRPEPSCRST